MIKERWFIPPTLLWMPNCQVLWGRWGGLFPKLYRGCQTDRCYEGGALVYSPHFTGDAKLPGAMREERGFTPPTLLGMPKCQVLSGISRNLLPPLYWGCQTARWFEGGAGVYFPHFTGMPNSHVLWGRSGGLFPPLYWDAKQAGVMRQEQGFIPPTLLGIPNCQALWGRSRGLFPPLYWGCQTARCYERGAGVYFPHFTGDAKLTGILGWSFMILSFASVLLVLNLFICDKCQ